MQQVSITKVLCILKINFHLAIRNNLVVAICYLLLLPVIRGTNNLDAVHSAECLEQSVILIGIVLIVPLFATERSFAIREVVFTKKINGWLILLSRIVMALIMLVILTCIFAGIMKWRNCIFPYASYVTGTIISSMALGSIGFLSAVLSNSTIIGYLVSMGYFLFNYLGDLSSTSIFYLFSMETGNFTTKIWLLGIGILSIMATLVYVKKKLLDT